MSGKYRVRFCENCNNDVKSNWKRHISSKKHQLLAGYITKKEARKDKKAQNVFVTFQTYMKYLVAKKFKGPQCKNWFKQNIQGLIVCNNYGFRNSHMVIRYKDPQRFVNVQSHLREIFGVRADDIKSCKDVKM